MQSFTAMWAAKSGCNRRRRIGISPRPSRGLGVSRKGRRLTAMTATDGHGRTAAKQTLGPWRRLPWMRGGLAKQTFPISSKWTSPEFVIQCLGDKGLT
jgi:hypothetical protein